MDILFIIVLTVSSLGLLYSIISLRRNTLVYRYRMSILNEIRKNQDNFEEKILEFESVSYDEMVYKFWKPLNSFYKTLGNKNMNQDFAIIFQLGRLFLANKKYYFIGWEGKGYYKEIIKI